MQKKYKVFKKVKESKLVSSLYLRLEDESKLENFKPGQHLLFKIKPEGQDHVIQRFYSFSEAPELDHYRISVKKELPPKGILNVPSGKGSTFIHNTIQVGDIIEAKGPMGDFFLKTEESEPVVLIAGGIGLTPLLSIVNTIINTNSKQLVTLFLGVTNNSDHIFKGYLDTINKAYNNIQIYTCYTNPLPTDRLGNDFDYEGFVHINFIKSKLPENFKDFYICGPSVMMDYISLELKKIGVSTDTIYTESFGPASVSYTAIEENNSQEKTEIIFSDSGVTVAWDNQFKSIVELAEANNIDISVGCLFGDCGTCMTDLTTGEVEYNHPTMIVPDPGSCLPCSCKPKGSITLNI